MVDPTRLQGDAIATAGESFADGAFVEWIHRSGAVGPELLLWDGHQSVVSEIVEHLGQRYSARFISATISRQLKLPQNTAAYGSVRELLSEICELLNQFVRLPENSTALIGRFVLATWLVDAMQTAPRLLICGPDSARARQLFQLLYCVCRRALPMTEVSPAGLCSLTSGMRFTLMLRQTEISSKLAMVLQAATVRGIPLLKSGELLDLFGAQVIQCAAGFQEETERASSIHVPCLPIGQQVSILGDEEQLRIAAELQPKLLAFRFANYRSACAASFDTSGFTFALHDLSTSLAVATPNDPDLQSELRALLKDVNAEVEAANWVDLSTVIIEAILVHCREARADSIYVGAIAEMAEVILEQRGSPRKVGAGEAGRRMKTLGFKTEPRDARGVKLLLNNEARVRAQELARQYQVPGA